MGLFSSKSKTKSSFEPYAPAKDFLLGNEDEGISGIFPEAGNLYEQGGFNPQMQGGLDKYIQQLDARQGQFGQTPNYNPTLQQDVTGYTNNVASDMMGGAYNVANGNYDTNYGPVGNINTPQTNLNAARRSQGALDPTQSLQGLLSGNVTNPYLQQQADAMTANMTRNLNENVMPGIRSEALASGQYGGSRQGIAEGLAASRLNQDLAPALTNMFGGAFENAQNRMYGTATGLNDQAFQNATNNAGLQMQGNQFNANLGLQNNAQQMGQNTQNLDNRMKSMDIANNAQGLLQGNQQLQAGNQSLLSGNQQLQLGGQQIQANNNNFQDQDFGSLMSAYGMPQNMDWQNLQNYQNTIYPGAQLGGSSITTTKNSPSTMSSIMGTASGIAGIGSMFMPGGAGMLGGAASGGLSNAAGGFSNASRGFMGGSPLKFGG